MIALNDLLPAWPQFSVFLIASFILAITPGPAVLYIVTRSLLQGRRFGLASVAGVALGNLGNALGASIGLAALFAVSSIAFMIVKYAGALYLVYLGLRALLAPQSETTYAAAQPARLKWIFRDGFVVALLNPKTTLFFAAFLPQFISTEAAPVVQCVALGSVFVAIAAITDTVYALTASAITPAFAQARGIATLGRYLTGGAFIGLGLFTALSGSRSGR